MSVWTKELFSKVIGLRTTAKLLISLLFIALVLFGMGIYSVSEALSYTVFILFVYASFVLIIKEKILSRVEPVNQDNDDEPRSWQRGTEQDYISIGVSIIIGLIFLFFSFRELVLRPGVVNSTILPFWPKFSILGAMPFNPIDGYSAGNNRFFISELYTLLPSLFLNSILFAQVLQTFLQFMFVYIVAVLVARSVYTLMDIQINKVAFYTIFGLIAVLNPVFLVEGSVFTLDSLFMVYIFVIILRNLNKGYLKKLDFLRLGFAISFMVFLDPRYIVLLFISLLFILICSLIYRSFRRLLVLITESAIVWIPFAILLIVMFHFTPDYVANQGRSGSISNIIGFSVNTGAINIWTMLGNWWPGFVFSSPNIITLTKQQILSSSTYGYSNPLMLYFKGFLQIFWALLMGSFSLISLSSLYFMWKREEDNKLPILFIPFAVIFIFVLGGNIGILQILQLEASISNIPFIGGIWAVTIAVTPWLQGAIVSFLLILFSYSLSNIYKLQLITVPKNKLIKRGKIKIHSKHIIIFLLVLAVLLPSWQFVFPQYSLGAADPGLPGNHVSLVGPYYPTHPPTSFIRMYKNLSAQSNMTYSVYSNDAWYIPEKWDPGILSIAPPGVPPSPGFYSIFSEIFSENLSSEVIPLSEMYGVKYFFIDNSTTQNNTPMINFLDHSGMSVYYAGKNVTVFESPSSSNIIGSNLLIGYSNESNISLLDAYSALRSQFLYPSFVNSSEPINLELSNVTGSSNISLIDYQDFLSQEQRIPAFFGPEAQGFSNATFISLYNDWSIFNPGNRYYTKYVIKNNSFTITPETSDRVSTNGNVNVIYKVPLFNGVTDIPIPEYNNTIVSVHGTIRYSVNGSSNGLTIGFPANNGSLVNNGGFTVNLPLGINMTDNFTGFLPKNSRTFSVQLSASALNGTLNVSKLDINYTYTYDGSTYVNHSKGINVELSQGTYRIIVKGLNNNSTSETFESNVAVSRRSNYNVNLGNLSYLTWVIIIPTGLENRAVVPVIKELRYQNVSASLSFYAGNGTSYVDISYNPNYRWSHSSNLKYVGANSMGIQIFKVEVPGYTELYVHDSYTLFVVEIIASVMIDGILPLMIFVIYPMSQKKKAKGK